ncbi:MAG: hypothetical protein SW833_27895 [Cyanobacteriota bacterium]|nr:hypothetical protein [Cyanobacteriota bacterium]
MPVIVMEVDRAELHPNADSLRVYQMKAAGYDEVQIIANLETVYKTGDRVAIALVDSVLKDGTKIKPSKLRGLRSFGMALGKVKDSVGTDLSEVYCQKTMTRSVQFQAWPSIELFYNLCRSLEKVGQTPTLTYRAKIKLDGTNAGVQIFTDGRVAKLEVEPDKIRDVVPNHPDIFILPFYGDSITLDFSDKEQLKARAEVFNQMVQAVETSDPWVKETFGVEGIGEGLVFYPEMHAPQNGSSRDLSLEFSFSELLFKAKGEKHQAVKTKKPVQIDPEKVRTVGEFVNLFVTSARLEQGVTEACAGEFDIKKMGNFLQWLSNDVKKESVAELERAQLIWKDVSKPVMNAAREWYQQRAKSI